MGYRSALGVRRWTLSVERLLPAYLDLIRVRNLDEYVFECCATLRKFAQRPFARGREPENFFTHVETGFDAERKYLPIVVLIRRHVADTGDLLQFFGAVVFAGFCFDHHAASLANLAEQIFRRVAGFDPALVNNDNAAAGH